MYFVELMRTRQSIRNLYTCQIMYFKVKEHVSQKEKEKRWTVF